MRSVGDVRHFSGSCFVRFGHQSCCCSAVSEAFLQVIPSIGFLSAFRSCFAWFWASIGLNPSSSIMRSVGDVRHFSGWCFVRFGHQSCCCSAVSEAFLQVIPAIGFLSAFRSCFAWFWASIGLNPSSSIMRSVGDVPHFGLLLFSKSFLPLVFQRLFARVSHGLGLTPSGFLMRSLGDVRQFSGSCFVRFGPQSCCCAAVSEAFLQVIPTIGFLSAFRSCFAWFWPQLASILLALLCVP